MAVDGPDERPELRPDGALTDGREDRLWAPDMPREPLLVELPRATELGAERLLRPEPSPPDGCDEAPLDRPNDRQPLLSEAPERLAPEDEWAGEESR